MHCYVEEVEIKGKKQTDSQPPRGRWRIILFQPTGRWKGKRGKEDDAETSV